jgi:UDP-N-acetylmuramate dehydrogenase
VGASAVQNVGAYGVEAKDLIVQVKAIEILTGNERIFSNQECNYAYRDSIFKNELKGKYIITSVIYRLDKHLNPKLEYGGLAREVGENVNLNAIRKAIIRIRKQKLPEVSALGSAGSFFKNPIVTCEQYNALLARYATIPHYEQDGGVKIPAAWLIEQCGWKGRALGKAAVHHNQALVLVNIGDAEGKDILQLSNAVSHDVQEKFDIILQPEVNFIGQVVEE